MILISPSLVVPDALSPARTVKVSPRISPSRSFSGQSDGIVLFSSSMKFVKCGDSTSLNIDGGGIKNLGSIFEGGLMNLNLGVAMVGGKTTCDFGAVDIVLTPDFVKVRACEERKIRLDEKSEATS